MDKVNSIIEEVAAEFEWDLLLEKDKTELIIFRTKRKGKRKDVKWVKWFGIIVDEDLLFDHQKKSRIFKMRSLLGALSGIENSNWGI